MSVFSLKPSVFSGIDVDEVIASYKSKTILIVCDGFLVTNSSVKDVIEQLKENHNTVYQFSDIVPDPPIAKVISLVQQIVQIKPEVIFAIGGGSAIDTAKAARYFAQKGNQIVVDEFIVIPSTSGSGSEVTSVAVVTDTDKNSKYPLVDSYLIPDKVLFVPELLLSCPPNITAHSGLDVLTHAIEAYVAKGATGLTDSLAIQAIKLVFKHLEDCYKDGNNLKARIAMQEASLMAALAFQNAGLGLVHAVSHQLGGCFHLPHGLINSIVLPHVITLNAKQFDIKQKYADIAREMGWITKTDAASSGLLALNREIKALRQRLGCQDNLISCGIEASLFAEQLSVCVEQVYNDFTYTGNPVEVSKKELVEVLLKSFQCA